MAENTTNTAYTDENLGYVYENRRYVGGKETMGFVLWDAAQSLNINTYSTRFITNIVKKDDKIIGRLYFVLQKNTSYPDVFE